MATSSIDWNAVINYSKINCYRNGSHGKCAAYVKNAFAAGGCTYISGNGWNNQNFCKTNGFECIADYTPNSSNPRVLPSGYTQQVGDICLIKEGTYGHICYATGTNINDWVSDYWQRPPFQTSGTGPFCYPSTKLYERVQFWRHSSVLNGAPTISVTTSDITTDYSYQSFASSSEVNPTRITSLSSIGNNNNTDDDNMQLILGTDIRQR